MVQSLRLKLQGQFRSTAYLVGRGNRLKLVGQFSSLGSSAILEASLAMTVVVRLLAALASEPFYLWATHLATLA